MLQIPEGRFVDVVALVASVGTFGPHNSKGEVAEVVLKDKGVNEHGGIVSVKLNVWNDSDLLARFKQHEGEVVYVYNVWAKPSEYVIATTIKTYLLPLSNIKLKLKIK